MSYLLEILGRGLLAELSAAFRDLLRDDDPAPAAELLARIEREPGCAAHRRQLGIQTLAAHRSDSAQALFESALCIDSEDRISRIGLACALDEQRMTHRAVEQLRIALDQDGDDGPVWFAMGFCQEKLGDTGAAIASYEEALDIAPELRNTHERLAAIYLKLDNLPMATTHYEHLCWCKPDDLGLRLTLANLYARAGRHHDAIAHYEHALILDPDNWETQDDLVSACADGGRYEDAVELLWRIIQQHPESADQHVRLGDMYTKLGRDGDAHKAYETAVALSPDSLEATIKAGRVQLRLGAFGGAAQAFTRAIEINDQIVSAYVGLGVAREAAGDAAQAQSNLEMAAEVEPNSAVLFSELARLQLHVTAAQQAQRYLSPKTIAATPEGPQGAKVATMIEQQIANLRAALTAHPNHADWHYQLGLLLRETGDLGGAIDSFRRAVTVNPSYVKALTRLGLALREAGQLDDAITTLEQAIRIDNETIDLHYQLGLMFADQEHFMVALDRFERAAAEEPTNPDYVANIALTLQNAGLIDPAEARWDSLCALAEETARGRALLSQLGEDAGREPPS